MIPYSYQTIYTSPSVSQGTFIIFIINFFLTETGLEQEYLDMESILSVYLKDKALETLPYITGYCGEFGILQQAGPRRIPGSTSMSGSVTITYNLSQILEE